MPTPGKQLKDYDALYHDFTVAYADFHLLKQELYPTTKRFIETTEPELNRLVKRLESGTSSNATPMLFQTLMKYMSHFDDFILEANRFFGELKEMHNQCDGFMQKVLAVKANAEQTGNQHDLDALQLFTPELDNLLNQIRQMPEKADALDKKMKKLTEQWVKTKDKMRS